MDTELTREDQLRWRKFLTSETGVRGLLHLEVLKPGVTKEDSTGIILGAGITEGYSRCLKNIRDIIAGEQVKEIDVENR